YYLAMKTPGFEADRFAIMAMDLASGEKHEIDPQWDRSPGGLSLSDDGKTLYATADDAGTHPLFAIDIETGSATQIFGAGTIGGYDVAGDRIVAARADFQHPTDLYEMDTHGGNVAQVTHFNAERL